MYYVTMTDSFLSNWGDAQGKINKLVFECPTYQEAEIVAQNASNRSDMKRINISTTKPSYSSNKYNVQYKTTNEYPQWYQEGCFKKK